MGLVLGRALFCGVVTHISSPFKKTCLCDLLNLYCSSAMILWHSAPKSFSYCIAVSVFNCYGSRDRYCCFHFQKKNQEKHCRSLSCVFPLIYLFRQSLHLLCRHLRLYLLWCPFCVKYVLRLFSGNLWYHP